MCFGGVTSRHRSRNAAPPSSPAPQDGLRKVRKELVISTGAIEVAPPPPAPGAGNGKAGGKKGHDVTQGPMFKKFFKGSGEEEPEDDEPNSAQPARLLPMDYTWLLC